MIELRFTEDEAAEVLWALAEAIDLADQFDAWSTLAQIDGTYRMVRRPFDDRREE